MQGGAQEERRSRRTLLPHHTLSELRARLAAIVTKTTCGRNRGSPARRRAMESLHQNTDPGMPKPHLRGGGFVGETTLGDVLCRGTHRMMRKAAAKPTLAQLKVRVWVKRHAMSCERRLSRGVEASQQRKKQAARCWKG